MAAPARMHQLVVIIAVVKDGFYLNIGVGWRVACMVANELLYCLTVMV
jgi:hypothetical protein